MNSARERVAQITVGGRVVLLPDITEKC